MEACVDLYRGPRTERERDRESSIMNYGPYGHEARMQLSEAIMRKYKPCMLRKFQKQK